MRNFVGFRISKPLAAVLLAGVLAAPLYFFAKPGDALERPSQRISGRAAVVDGDTIEISGIRIRLEGIDAPELRQSCPRRWYGEWPAGRDAAAALGGMVAGRRVTCQSHGTDKYGRMLGVCFVGPQDLNRAMVRRGLAWAFVRYSRRYVTDEQSARAARRGIWQASCRPAWRYRAARWSNGAEVAPGGCAIKGNISAGGRRVYHMPWGRWYAKTKIEPGKGERWFCSEREALDAGWRPSGS
jgi:endonuclease YncB( thermonuclease family)